MAAAKRMTKAQVIGEIAQYSELDKKSVSKVFEGLTDLIKKQTASIRLTDKSDLVTVRPRERSFDVTEQLRLDEVLRECRAVYFYKRFVRTTALVMHGVRDDLFTSS